MRFISTFIIFFVFTNQFYCQELNCQVVVSAPQLQGTVEKQILDQLQKSIYEFMNNTKWTNDNFTGLEKIECSIAIIVDSKSGADDYSGSIQVQCRRPIFKTSYYSTLFNYLDKRFTFKYQQFQQLEFNVNNFQNNLTSVLAFYAYIFLAYDYDSFALLGGTPFYQKAQIIVANAQSAVESGWRSNETSNNRYWIPENALQPIFQPVREAIYKYHRFGLDVMHQNAADGRNIILNTTDLLLEVAKIRPASFIMELFFNAKTDEFVNLFQNGTSSDKQKAVNNLSTIYPTQIPKFSKITAN